MDHYWIDVNDAPDIPEITDDHLQWLLQIIKPLYKYAEGPIYTFKLPDLRNASFTWEVHPIKPVAVAPIRVIKSLHSCGYHGIFKPSIAECFAAIVEDDDTMQYVDCFYIDMQAPVGIYSSGDRHEARLTLGKIIWQPV